MVSSSKFCSCWAVDFSCLFGFGFDSDVDSCLCLVLRGWLKQASNTLDLSCQTSYLPLSANFFWFVVQFAGVCVHSAVCAALGHLGNREQGNLEIVIGSMECYLCLEMCTFVCLCFCAYMVSYWLPVPKQVLFMHKFDYWQQRCLCSLHDNKTTNEIFACRSFNSNFADAVLCFLCVFVLSKYQHVPGLPQQTTKLNCKFEIVRVWKIEPVWLTCWSWYIADV